MKMVDHATLFDQEGAHLGETMQKSLFRFSLAIKDGDVFERLMPFVACRDFFNDFFIYGFNQKDPRDIYGYCPSPNIPKDKRFFLLVGDSTESTDNIEKAVSEVNATLKENKMKSLKVIHFKEVDGAECSQHDYACLKNFIALDVPAYWFNNAYSVALLTYLIRINDVNVEPEHDEVQMSFRLYLKSRPEGYVKHVKYLPKLYKETDSFVGTSTDADKYTLHDCGLVYYNRHLAAGASPNVIIQKLTSLMRKG